jgi:hypothetical protein
MIDDKNTQIFIGPDFLVFDHTEEKSFGIGEVKCPFSKKDVCIEEACKDKNFYLGIANGKIQLKKTHNYYYQIQGCMATLNVFTFTNSEYISSTKLS